MRATSPSTQGRFLLTAILFGAFLAASAGFASSDQNTFFEERIRPLLIEHCYECHSTEHKIKGGLNLDTRAGWQTGGDSGPALKPDDAEGSLLMKAVSYHDRDLKMPPKRKLTETQIADLHKWISTGAHDPRDGTSGPKEATVDVNEGRNFWAFQLPQRHEPPAVQNKAWPANEVDHFILARLEAEGLTPAPNATDDTLVRRLYFDLTGLPPSAEEWENYRALRQQFPAQAYEMLVDRLIATPQFGERWGRNWLDLARFAESSGGGRTLPFKDAWRYRDYVIESINEDVPLNRFITEQIAGDLLPHDTPEQRRRQVIATGFLALGPTNYEEQDKGALRMDIIDEQLETIGKSFLGMTIGCARCHDHKFDPIPITDYYALAGILRSTRTLKNYTDNVARWVDTPLPMAAEEEVLVTAQEKELESARDSLAQARKELKKLQGKGSTLTKDAPIRVDEVTGLVVDDSQARKIGPWKESKRYPTYIGEGYLTDANLNKGEATLTFAPTIPTAGKYEVRVAYQPLSDRASNVPITILHAEGEENIQINQREIPPVDGRFISLGQFHFEKNGEGFVLISNEGTDGYVTVDAVVFVPVDQVGNEAAKEPADNKSAMQMAKTEINHLEKTVKELDARRLRRQEAMSVREEDKIEDSPVHIRGNIRNLGPSVPRGFLTVALYDEPPVIDSQTSGRKELAAWLTSHKNPLTARVLTNRAWMWLFDEGLVRSVDNLGVTGEKPTHPELLDTLAVDFMEDGWSLKRLVKRLVMTRAYRMDSRLDARLHAVDPENRLLGRQNRKRLPAEAIRDAMLAVSGQLNPKMYGTNLTSDSVDANTEAAQNLEYSFVFRDTRRSVYTPAFRNRRLDIFEVFDFADINQPPGRRHASSVAPQALYMLNHPFVLEQSREAANRLLAKAQSDEDLIRQAYRAALGREPNVNELQMALAFLAPSSSGSSGSANDSRETNWALFLQTLFASLNFRHLD